MCSDVVVLVGGYAAVTARVIISDAPDDQITADQKRVLLIPETKPRKGEVHFFEHILSLFQVSFHN